MKLTHTSNSNPELSKKSQTLANLSQANTQQSQTEFFFHLSGYHPHLPKFELMAILESEKYPYKLLENHEQCVILQCSNEGAQLAAWRAA